MANELLQKALLAHGGLDRWNRFEKVQVVDALVGGGGFLWRCGLSLSGQERGSEQKRDPDAA